MMVHVLMMHYLIGEDDIIGIYEDDAEATEVMTRIDEVFPKCDEYEVALHTIPLNQTMFAVGGMMFDLKGGASFR